MRTLLKTNYYYLLLMTGLSHCEASAVNRIAERFVDSSRRWL